MLNGTTISLSCGDGVDYAITKGSNEMTFIAATKTGKIGKINLGLPSG